MTDISAILLYIFVNKINGDITRYGAKLSGIASTNIQCYCFKAG